MRSILSKNSDNQQNYPDDQGTFSSLRYRNLRLLWIGQTGHAAALWMEQIARPWLVLEITNNNAAHVGGVVAMRVLPQLLFGIWAGVITDRLDRKQLLFATKIGVFILNIVFAVLLVTNLIELWHIYLVSFIRGFFMATDNPARQSLIADAVPSELVMNAVALMSATQNVMRIGGVMLSGLLIALLGVTGTFVIIAIVYLITVIATYLIDIPPIKRPPMEGFKTIKHDLAEGFRFALRQSEIRGVLIIALVFYATGMMWMQLFAPLFAREVMNLGAFGFSELVATGGLGSLLGSLYLAIKRPTRPGINLTITVALTGITLMFFAIAPSFPNSWGSIAPFIALFFVGIFNGGFMPLTQTIMLNATPEQLRGRVISLMSLDRAMMTVGAFLGGLTAEYLGAQPAQFIYGVITLIGGITVFAMAKGLRDYNPEHKKA